MEPLNFLLVGNGTYANRGCEAIVRGTLELLRHEFGAETTATLVSIGTEDEFRRQRESEYDPGIRHVFMRRELGRWSLNWWERQSNKYLNTSFCSPLSLVKSEILAAAAVLEIGGDNYSLDYALPWRFIEMDRYVLKHRRPVVIWGGSVGPFKKNLKFESIMMRHLQKLSAILVRESISLDYLKGHGLKNIYPVSDPAFAMKAVEPAIGKVGFSIPQDAVGINLSPLMARYATGGDMTAWESRCVEIVQAIPARFGLPVILVPHVGIHDCSDWTLLRNVFNRLEDRLKESVHLVPETLGAAEVKYLIAQCAALVASRTHATIAGFSSHVPTLSLAYSVKAQGLNVDLFGTQDYCLGAGDLHAEGVAGRLELLLHRRKNIRQGLAELMPEVVQRAYDGAKILRNISRAGVPT